VLFYKIIFLVCLFITAKKLNYASFELLAGECFDYNTLAEQLCQTKTGRNANEAFRSNWIEKQITYLRAWLCMSQTAP